ncbi:hypothetical protein K6119_06300 [Paracrocinitomix mangrovi]|uniref:hypothetical protein n=1 Tax=Paracrocinitomix mangrovi TaxID=2862509 RepID=UPI001C8EEA1A|nr:hypothetical protein [Paracrocinitomix mangrovi]UKN03123.1 hypothetical protein K6119_06300 [Paracrocinitomix mangrovi]
MEILNKAEIVEKDDCLISLNKVPYSGSSILQLDCIGKYSWKSDFVSGYGMHAMIFDFALFDLPGKYFIAWQGTEHDRGGHCDFEFELCQTDGTKLWRVHSRIKSDFIKEDKYLWFLFNGHNQEGIYEKDKFFLYKLNLTNGDFKQKILLNFKSILNVDFDHTYRKQLIVENGVGYITVEYSKNGIQGIKKVRVPISKF